MSEALKQKILAATPLAALIGEHVTLTDKGYIKVGLCPFHEERGASFTVYPDHFHCFGCKASGDAISFVRKHLGMGFIDALKHLAARAGIDASELDQQRFDGEKRKDIQALFRLMAAAQQFFVQRLQLHPRVLDYARSRGFSPENIDAFGFGFAPDETRSLTDALSRLPGAKIADIESCSLSTPSAKNGQHYDFFRNRLMIPIHDIHGRLIAFGGRAMDDYPPKYKNSRDTPLFDKSQTLFGLHRARECIRKGDPAILVEGYMDTLQLWQQGFGGTTACMGTALRTSHLRSLHQLTNRLYLLFDGDAAGQKASLSTLTSSLEVPKLDLRVVRLPADEDPDTFVMKHGPPALHAAIDQAEPLIDFALRERLAENRGLNISEALQKDILPWLRQVSDGLKRALILNRVSFYSGVSRDTLERELKAEPRLASARPALAKAVMPRAQARPLDGLQFDLLGQLFFAQPGDLDPMVWEDFIRKEMDLDELWADFAHDCLVSIKEGTPPAEADRTAWLSGVDSQVVECIDQFKKRQLAFKVDNRRHAMERIRLAWSLKKHQAQVAKLREKLNASDRESMIQILAAIKDLNLGIDKLTSALQKSLQ